MVAGSRGKQGDLLKEVGPLTKGMKYKIPSLPGKGTATYLASCLLTEQLPFTTSKSHGFSVCWVM